MLRTTMKFVASVISSWSAKSRTETMTFNLSLRTVRLRDVGYWQAFMHRNALMYVHGHAGTENVQVGITHGVAEGRLEKLVGDISVPFKFLPGNELVQLIVTELKNA